MGVLFAAPAHGSPPPPSPLARRYNVALNVVGSFSGQAAQTLIAGVALRVAPLKLGASFIAIIGTITSLFTVGGLEVARAFAALPDTFTLCFWVGGGLFVAGCVAAYFLGDAARPPPPAAKEVDDDSSGADVASPNNPLLVVLDDGDKSGAAPHAAAAGVVRNPLAGFSAGRAAAPLELELTPRGKSPPAQDEGDAADAGALPVGLPAPLQPPSASGAPCQRAGR